MARDAFIEVTRETPAYPQLREGMRLFPNSAQPEGRYELLQFKGAGGMGVVWKARDHIERRDCAMKFMPGLLLHNEKEVRRMIDEVKIGKDIRHPCVAATYGMERDDQHMAIVMQFVIGKSLADMIEQVPFFEPAQIQKWVHDIASALDYLHSEAKIFHRDIKPSNIMIDENGRALVMDFGISHRVKESVIRQSRTTPGGPLSAKGATLAYASPGQLRGHPHSAADDFYSVGAMIYELLTGTPPFFRGTSEEIIRQQILNEPLTSMTERRKELVADHTHPTIGETIPTAWEVTISACLEKDIKHRISSGKELLAALAGKRNKPAGIALSIVAAVAVTAGAGIWAWQHKPSLSMHATAELATTLAQLSMLSDDDLRSLEKEIIKVPDEHLRSKFQAQLIAELNRREEDKAYQAADAWLTAQFNNLDNVSLADLAQQEALAGDTLRSPTKEKLASRFTQLKIAVQEASLIQSARSWISVHSTKPLTSDKAEIEQWRMKLATIESGKRAPILDELASIEQAISVAEEVQKIKAWINSTEERSGEEIAMKEREIASIASAADRKMLTEDLEALRATTLKLADSRRAEDVQQRLDAFAKMNVPQNLSQSKAIAESIQRSVDTIMEPTLRATLKMRTDQILITIQQHEEAGAIDAEIRQITDKTNTTKIEAIRSRIAKLTDRNSASVLSNRLNVIEDQIENKWPAGGKPISVGGTKGSSGNKPDDPPRPVSKPFPSGTYHIGKHRVVVDGSRVTVWVPRNGGSDVKHDGKIDSSGHYSASNSLGGSVNGTISR